VGDTIPGLRSGAVKKSGGYWRTSDKGEAGKCRRRPNSESPGKPTKTRRITFAGPLPVSTIAPFPHGNVLSSPAPKKLITLLQILVFTECNDKNSL